MRTLVLNVFHTEHPEAQAEHDRLALEERRIQRERARRGEDDGEPQPKRRASEKPADLDAELADVRAKIDAQKATIRSGWGVLSLQSLPRKEFRTLLSDHPPRDGDPADAAAGFNVDTFGEALISASIAATLSVAPDGTPGDPAPEGAWDKWAQSMPDGYYDEVFIACWKLNRDPMPAFPR